MAKGSDLHSRMGMGGTPVPKPKNVVDVEAGAKKEEKKESVASQKFDVGHNLHKGSDKSKGGAGGAGGRPKV